MDNDWINARIEVSLNASPVPDTVVSVVRERLHGTLSERALRGAEVAELAMTLLAAVNKPPAEGKA